MSPELRDRLREAHLRQRAEVVASLVPDRGECWRALRLACGAALPGHRDGSIWRYEETACLPGAPAWGLDLARAALEHAARLDPDAIRMAYRACGMDVVRALGGRVGAAA